jgi:hypothetical protein
MRLSLSRSSLGSVPPVDLLDVGDRARKVGEFTGIFLKLGRVDTLRAREEGHDLRWMCGHFGNIARS